MENPLPVEKIPSGACLFDVGDLKILIQMNMDPLDLKIPMADEFKIHFMAQRRRILENYRNQATGMAMMMQCVVPGMRGHPEYVEAQSVLLNYQEWIKTELRTLDGFGPTPL